MLIQAIEGVTWTLMLGGVFFAVVGGIGLLRLPDVFSRMHGAGMTDTLGAGLILGGLLFHSLAGTLLLRIAEHPEEGLRLNGVEVHAGDGLVAFKIAAILAFLLITSPTATHALSRAALLQNVRPWAAEQKDKSSND